MAGKRRITIEEAEQRAEQLDGRLRTTNER
jgi:hypothetical protein